MSDDLRDIQPLTGAVLGTILLGGGLTIVFIALEWIHVDPAAIHVPRWVLGICGLMFMIPGFAVAGPTPARSVRIHTRDRRTTWPKTLAGAPDHAHESVDSRHEPHTRSVATSCSPE